MTLLFTFLPLALMFGLYAAAVKSAAWILRRINVSWKHAFMYVGTVIFLAVVFKVLIAVAGIRVSLVLALLISLLLQAVCGAWFFAKRATTRDGLAIGRLGGVRLSATAFLLVAAFTYLFMVFGPVLPNAP
jgi:hypothetical protein